MTGFLLKRSLGFFRFARLTQQMIYYQSEIFRCGAIMHIKAKTYIPPKQEKHKK